MRYVVKYLDTTVATTAVKRLHQQPTSGTASGITEKIQRTTPGRQDNIFNARVEEKVHFQRSFRDEELHLTTG